MNAPTLSTILAPGAFATVPPKIGAGFFGRDVPATLLCFPSCIPYVSVRRGLTSDARRTFVANYYPVFDSARFDEGSVQLSYRWIHDSPFTVHVLRETTSSRWHVFKCCGSKLLSQIVGDSYGDAMIRATSIGLSDREPAFTFDGITPATIDEIREENLTQIALAEGSELDDDDFSQHNVEDELIKRPQLPSKQTLVFGNIRKPGEVALIFIPEVEAVRLATIHRAIATAKTWCEFFRLMPATDRTHVLNSMRDCDDAPQPSGKTRGQTGRSPVFDPARTRQQTRSRADLRTPILGYDRWLFPKRDQGSHMKGCVRARLDSGPRSLRGGKRVSYSSSTIIVTSYFAPDVFP